MTYIGTEESVQDGSPIELYLFQNAEEKFAFTSGNTEVTYNFDTYVPFPIKRTEPGLGGKLSSSTLTVTLDSDNPFTNRYIGGIPPTPDSLTIFRQHALDGDNETITFWSGTIATVTWEGDEVKVSVSPAVAELELAIPRRTTSYSCNHVLYDGLCGVDRELFRSDVIVGAISPDGLEISVTNDPAWSGTSASDRVAADATFFNAGFIQTVDNLKFRMIMNYTVGTSIITVPIPFDAGSVSVGDTIKLFGGCDRTAGTCFDKFDNIAQYGGFPHVPVKNPFQSGIV